MDPSDILKKYEKTVYLILIVLFAIIVAFSIAQLTFILFTAIALNSPGLLVDHELLDIIGYFLLVLIGVELLATISVYMKENVIHVDTVLIVAIIAISRTVILLEPGGKDTNAVNMFATAALIFALCTGYYFVKKAEKRGT